MTKAVSLLASAAVAITMGMSGCAENSQLEETNNQGAIEAEGKPKVVVSSSILCDLTAQIAQETIAQTCLINREQDPHTYNTNTSSRKAIETAQLVLYDGYNLVPAIEDLVTSVDSPAPKVAVYEEAVTKPIMAAHHHHDHEQENSQEKEELEADPHVWHDVENVIAAVEVIEKELAAVNPDQAEFYQKNAEQFQERLKELDNWVKKQVATIPQTKRTLVTTHEAFNYYTQAYGFTNSKALQGISTEDSPAAADVKQLVKMLKEIKVPTIFSEAAGNDKIIATVAREAKVKVADEGLRTETLGNKDSETGTYIGMIVTNTCIIVEGLDGQCSMFNVQ